MDSMSKVAQPEFGQRIRQRRQELGLSQREVAGEHVTPSYVSLLESGNRMPTLDVIIHLARALQISPQELTGRSLVDLVGEGIGTETPAKDSSSVPPFPLVTRALIHSAVEAEDLATAAELTLQVLTHARDSQDEEQLLSIGIEASSLLRSAGRHKERLALLLELSQLGLVRRSDQFQVMLLPDLASAQREAGQLLEARSTIESLLPLVRQENHAGTCEHVRVLGVYISILCEIGDTEPVGALVEQMLALAAKLDRPAVAGRAQWIASMAYLQLGEHEAAYAQFTDARRTLASPNMPLADWLRFCRSSAGLLLTVGQIASAREWIDEAEGTVNRLGIPAERAAVLALRARYEAVVGNLDEALTHYTTLTGPDSPLTGLDLVRVEMSMATVLQQLDRPDEAVELLRDAAKRCEQLGRYQLAVQAWRMVDELRR
ncbi:helix-turn-helix transcriptional regulator [Micromonospora sp. NPDC047134]|uniref:helix-turn-helix transcriptional regulator n=1 Tax=Micromonospora sp. NPDC047134 TaxID=3154340 RepID=UPI0033F36AA4